MYFNRFDIVSAYYLYYCHHYNGIHSDEYRRLCHMQRYFRPSPTMSDNPYDVSENCGEIYFALVSKNK